MKIVAIAVLCALPASAQAQFGPRSTEQSIIEQRQQDLEYRQQQLENQMRQAEQDRQFQRHMDEMRRTDERQLDALRYPPASPSLPPPPGAPCFFNCR